MFCLFFYFYAVCLLGRVKLTKYPKMLKKQLGHVPFKQLNLCTILGEIASVKCSLLYRNDGKVEKCSLITL